MLKFDYHERFAPPHGLRARQAAAFLRIMQDAFEVSAWEDAEERRIVVSDEVVLHYLQEEAKVTEIDRLSINWVLKSIDLIPPVLAVLGVGGDEWSDNSFNLDFSRTQKRPDINYFRQAIDATGPTEAFLDEADNAEKLRSLWRAARSQRRVVSGLRSFHYMNGSLIEQLGGMAHCLRTPAFKVDRFAGGLLFQLTSDPYDVSSSEFRDVQIRGMEHLGII